MKFYNFIILSKNRFQEIRLSSQIIFLGLEMHLIKVEICSKYVQIRSTSGNQNKNFQEFSESSQMHFCCYKIFVN